MSLGVAGSSRNTLYSITLDMHGHILLKRITIIIVNEGDWGIPGNTSHETRSLVDILTIHSIGMCRIGRFLAVLSSFFHSFLSHTYTLFFHTFPPTSLPSSLISSCHLFHGLPLSLVVSKLVYNTFYGILFSSILCTCPNQRRYSNYGVLISKKGINTRSVMSVCPHGKPLLPLDGFSWNLVSEDLSKHLSRDVKGD